MQATIRKSNKVRRSKGDVIFDTVVYIITGLMILIAIYPIQYSKLRKKSRGTHGSGSNTRFLLEGRQTDRF